MNRLSRALLDWYAKFGRSQLPWRTVRDPYYTLVSEFMLQQTQVDRVIPKFEAFVARYPDIASLARSATSDVVRLWQGLGYNSRATRLVELARIVAEHYGGKLPRDADALRSLPGVGPYTVAAIRAFGFDEDDAALDTNIRRIVHRLYFGIEFPSKATHAQIDAQARASVPAGAGHDWNSAMMDLGATICTARAPKCLLCPLQRDCAAAPVDAAALEAARREHAKPASPQNAIPFEQTTRYARGRVIDRLRELPAGHRISLLDLHRQLLAVLPSRTADDVAGIVSSLERDGLVARHGETVALKD